MQEIVQKIQNLAKVEYLYKKKTSWLKKNELAEDPFIIWNECGLYSLVVIMSDG